MQMIDLKYCKDCKNAKPQQDQDGIQFCGKHRRFVTEHTLAKDLYKKCKDYEEVKK